MLSRAHPLVAIGSQQVRQASGFRDEARDALVRARDRHQEQLGLDVAATRVGLQHEPRPIPHGGIEGREAGAQYPRDLRVDAVTRRVERCVVASGEGVSTRGPPLACRAECPRGSEDAVAKVAVARLFVGHLLTIPSCFAPIPGEQRNRASA